MNFRSTDAGVTGKGDEDDNEVPMRRDAPRDGNPYPVEQIDMAQTDVR